MPDVTINITTKAQLEGLQYTQAALEKEIAQLKVLGAEYDTIRNKEKELEDTKSKISFLTSGEARNQADLADKTSRTVSAKKNLIDNLKKLKTEFPAVGAAIDVLKNPLVAVGVAAAYAIKKTREYIAAVDEAANAANSWGDALASVENVRVKMSELTAETKKFRDELHAPIPREDESLKAIESYKETLKEINGLQEKRIDLEVKLAEMAIEANQSLTEEDKILAKAEVRKTANLRKDNERLQNQNAEQTNMRHLQNQRLEAASIEEAEANALDEKIAAQKKIVEGTGKILTIESGNEDKRKKDIQEKINQARNLRDRYANPTWMERVQMIASGLTQPQTVNMYEQAIARGVDQLGQTTPSMVTASDRDAQARAELERLEKIQKDKRSRASGLRQQFITTTWEQQAATERERQTAPLRNVVTGLEQQVENQAAIVSIQQQATTTRSTITNLTKERQQVEDQIAKSIIENVRGMGDSVERSSATQTRRLRQIDEELSKQNARLKNMEEIIRNGGVTTRGGR